MQTFAIHTEPPSLTMGPARGRAVALASVVSLYVVGLVWLFSAGRLPWQAHPESVTHFVQDLRACAVGVGGVSLVIFQLWEAVGTRSFVLTSDSITFHAPLFGRRVVPLAELRHELTHTFIGGRRLVRVMVHLPQNRTITVAGGPEDYEPMLLALDAALAKPTADALRKLEPLAARVMDDQQGLARMVLVTAALGMAAFLWLALR